MISHKHHFNQHGTLNQLFGVVVMHGTNTYPLWKKGVAHSCWLSLSGWMLEPTKDLGGRVFNLKEISRMDGFHNRVTCTYPFSFKIIGSL